MRLGTRIFLPAMLALVAGAASVGHAPGAAAQPGTAAPGEDLRPVYATAADVADGRRVAQSCAGCHGANGISAVQDVPNLAGQRPGYVYAKLRAYQAGERGGHRMEEAVKFLNDGALVNVAAYYGSLEPAQPPPAGAAKPAPAKPDALAAGKARAAACAACHGESGVSRTPGNPSLVGLDPKYLVAAMNAYRGGQRRHEIMKAVLGSLGEADMRNIALYYALQAPARAQTPAAGDPAAGKSAAAACAGCHGEQGVSASPANPSLAGQDAQYLAAALRAYKDGVRKDETMKAIAAGLDERAAANLAAYYAAQAPRAPKVDKPLALADWVQRCERCHGVNGNSADPRTPALAAQRVQYLEKSLRAYQSGERKESVMAAMSAALTPDDIEALAAYYARQRARAFVYVVVPGK